MLFLSKFFAHPVDVSFCVIFSSSLLFFALYLLSKIIFLRYLYIYIYTCLCAMSFTNFMMQQIFSEIKVHFVANFLLILIFAVFLYDLSVVQECFFSHRAFSWPQSKPLIEEKDNKALSFVCLPFSCFRLFS